MTLPINLDNEKPEALDEEKILKDQSKSDKAAIDLFREILPSLMLTGKDILQDNPKYIDMYKQNIFIVNRALSHHIDCLGVAVVLNRVPDISPKSHYQVCLNTLRKRKRDYVKWKGEDDKKLADKEKKIAVISKFHGYSPRIAREIVDLYSNEQIDKMEKHMEEGG
jgi:hypothetical protein